MKAVLSVIVLLGSLGVADAQQVAPCNPTPQRCRCVRRLPARNPAPAKPKQPVNNPSPDFFVGAARVDVTKDETVVRLAMAQHGSVLIELPASDGPRYIIPGNPEMVTVDEKALERNKRAIIVRPGTLFLPPPRRVPTPSPAATVTAQMRSGLVVTFLFYPVEDLAQNVHRCVLRYNRDEVVARRRAAGLPVNLDSKEDRGEITAQSAAPQSISVELNEKPNTSSTPSPSPKAENGGSHEASAAMPVGGFSKPSSETPFVTAARDALAQAIKEPDQFKDWTHSVHGLSLSIIESLSPNQGFSVVVLAVKNNGATAVTLTSGPDLLLEMLDSEGRRLNIESIKTLHTESTNALGVIPARATVYYAVVYIPPVLGTHQQLKLAIGQTTAADEPASIYLNAGRTRRGI